MKTIVHPMPLLVHFAGLILLPVTNPQRQHLVRLADALCVCRDRKTLAALRRQWVDAPDESNWADFLRHSPWPEHQARQALGRFIVQDLLRRGHTPEPTSADRHQVR